MLSRKNVVIPPFHLELGQVKEASRGYGWVDMGLKFFQCCFIDVQEGCCAAQHFLAGVAEDLGCGGVAIHNPGWNLRI